MRRGRASRRRWTRRRLLAQRIDDGLQHRPGANQLRGGGEIVAQDTILLEMRHRRAHASIGGARSETEGSRSELDGLSGGNELDGQYLLAIVQHLKRLAGGMRAHAHVVLLIG